MHITAICSARTACAGDAVLEHRARPQKGLEPLDRLSMARRRHAPNVRRLAIQHKYNSGVVRVAPGVWRLFYVAQSVGLGAHTASGRWI